MIDTMESQLTPGTYRLAELEGLFGRTRKTIERYIERFSLEKTEVDFAGRKVAAVILDQESIDRIKSEIGESFDTTDTNGSNANDIHSSLITLLEQEKNSLLEQLQASQREARQLDVDNARLAAKAESHEQLLALKDEALKAKDETIQSLKTSMVVLERANNQLQNEKHLLEDKQKPSMAFAPLQENKKNFWAKWFGG
jgi:septal ring factor EnvC (AmiA/AmiB activator)